MGLRPEHADLRRPGGAMVANRQRLYSAFGALRAGRKAELTIAAAANGPQFRA